MLGDDEDGTIVWPQIGEIDIMENRGDEPTVISGTLHGPGYSGGESIGKKYELTNSRFDTDFHIFGVEWGPDYVNFYVDDVLYNQITPEDVEGEWVYDHPFYIILNLAVGGHWTDGYVAPGFTEATYEIDYVRVYQ